jgi:hypothetical protein
MCNEMNADVPPLLAAEAAPAPRLLLRIHLDILEKLPHWKRVEAEDAEMKISEWVSRKRKLMWMARFGAEIAKHNALMISRSQNIADCE